MTPARTAIAAIMLLVASACSEPPAADEPAIRSLPAVAAPGSGEPHLAPGPRGSVIMSWLEPADDGASLRYSVLRDDQWSEPNTVASGDDWFVNWADFPSVVAIDDSLWAAHWLVKAAVGTYEYGPAIAASGSHAAQHGDRDDTAFGSYRPGR